MFTREKAHYTNLNPLEGILCDLNGPSLLFLILIMRRNALFTMAECLHRPLSRLDTEMIPN
jgi:hypothetical protein